MQSRHALHEIFVVRINRSGGRVRVCPGPGATSMHTQDGVYQICNVTVLGLINSTVLIVLIFTNRERSCGKVMFSQVFACSEEGEVGIFYLPIPYLPLSTYFPYFSLPTYLPTPSYIPPPIYRFLPTPP